MCECVFLQEPLKDHEDVAFYAEKIFDVDLDGDHIATMGYKQRKKANEGMRRSMQSMMPCTWD